MEASLGRREFLKLAGVAAALPGLGAILDACTG